MEFKLFEMLSNCKLQLEGVDLTNRNLDNTPTIGDAKYEVFPMNEKLEKYKSGWTKYCLISFPKVHSTSNKHIKVSSMLHLISALEPDVIIARVAKYSPTTKQIKVRYIICQRNREQLCSNLRELNLSLSRSYSYSGRVITADDFIKKGN